MPETSEANSRAPQAEYHRRLEILRGDLVQLQRRDKLLGYAKLSVLIAGIAAAVWIVGSGRISPYWILVAVAVFIFFAVLHERVVRAIERNARATLFYKRGLARINDEWAGAGQTGERFASDSHPYARDLDLFGNGGMFQLLCEARTAAGEEKLANWLLAPASPDEVRARHAAVADLRDRLDLREDLAVLGEHLRAGLQPDALVTWAESPALVASTFTRASAAVFAFLWLASLAVWVVWGIFVDPHLFGQLLILPVVVTIFNASFSNQHRRWTELVPRIEASCKGLPLFASVMARLEREEFSAPKIVELQSRLRAQGEVPSGSIARLGRLVDTLASRRNLIVVFMNRYIFYSLQTVFAIESWHKKFGASVRDWLAAVGEIEALCSLAAYSYEHPADVFPEFTAPSIADNVPCLEAQSFAHPLIPVARAVRNDVSLGGDLRLMIISGPNMAGKSTYVRAVGINAVLAQCGAPVRAAKLRLSPLSVAASVCVLDSLQGGISRFYAEILRVKMTIDLAAGPAPVLFLLDELLGGTNSKDRRAGAQTIVKTLVDRGGIGLITTHDLALAEIADHLGPRAANFHFEDRIEDGKLLFDYRLSPGIVRTSNALDLMRSIGIDV
jgi:MutS domain V